MRKAIVNANIASLRPSKPFECLPEYRVVRLDMWIVGLALQHADTPHPLALLRARRERPRSRTAEQSDELASLHSITSSASASSVEGTVRPMILAVVRFMTKSNLVGCSTGRSAGLAPRKILSTYAADRRNMSEKLGPYDIRPPASTNPPLS